MHKMGTTEELAYERTGTGPGVVLVHCLGGDRTTWGTEASRLAERWTVLNVELPGHGRSPAPERIDFAVIAEQLTSLIRREALAPARVIGHSIGGTIAAWTPFADSGAVGSVLIVDSSIGPAPWKEEELASIRSALAADHVKGLTDFYAPITSSKEQTARIVETARRVPVETFLQYPTFAKEHGVADRASQVRVPLGLIASDLLLEGADAQGQIRAGGYGTVPTFAWTHLKGTRHWTHWDAPEAHAAAVDGFLSAPWPSLPPGWLR
jgi:pimeloyl-ACP methyl ester carboxylesterase